MKELKIVYKPINDLVPYENNPRHNEEAVPYVKASIEKFGFKVPLIIDKHNVIVAGHTRLLAARGVGLTELPCVLADDLTDEQIKQLRLVDNKVSEFASWDFDKLNLELQDIEDTDMEDFGFIPSSDLDINDEEFYQNEKTKEKEPKKVVCPHCGQEFTL